MTALVFLFFGSSGVVAVGDQSAEIDIADTALARRLTAPMSTMIDGQSIDAALQSLQLASQINLWVDHDLDTSAVMQDLQLGPTLHTALQQIAVRIDAKVLPLDDVVLIGRDEWLDCYLSNDHSNSSRTHGNASSVLINISWPDAVTPSELLRFVRSANHVATVGDDGVARLPVTAMQGRPNLHDDLVHDHLRGGQWRGVRQSTAEELLEVGYGRPDANGSNDWDRDRSSRWKASYATTLSRRRLSDSISTADASAKLTVRDNVATVTGTAAAHREIRIVIMEALVAARQNQRHGKANNRTKTFDLTVENQPAGKVLASLAASSGRKLRVNDSARANLKTLISFQAKSKTLEELSVIVGQKIQIDVDWTATEIVVSPSIENSED